jgi:uncharacterized membrane protein HdeD (DUF308 family)
MKISFNEFMQLHVKGIRNTGIVLVVVGALAIIAPMAAALAIELILGWLILLAGITQVIHALRSKGSSRFWWEGGIGVLYCLVAFSLLLDPMQGLVTLTLLLTILFIAEGIFKIILALQLRPVSTWPWLLVSGLLSCALGFIILSNISGNASWVLGMMVGINFVFAGWALIKQASYFNKQ